MISVFLISKPLQYFNATNISDGNQRFCLLVNSFYNAEIVCNKIKNRSNYWESCSLFDNWDKAYSWVIHNKKKIANIYIDSDYGLRKQLYLRRLSSLNIFVYEEGIGNYRKYTRPGKKENKFLKSVYSVLGIKDYLGGYSHTKGIYLYDIEKFKQTFPNNKKALIQFTNSFRTHLSEFNDKDIFLNKTDNETIFKLKNKKVLIYLTGWKYNVKVNNLLTEYSNYTRILKPHPQIKSDELEEFKESYEYVLSGDTLIELFINEALSYVDEMVILHHNSSALLYFRNEQKIISKII